MALDEALRYIPGVHVQENQVNVLAIHGLNFNNNSSDYIIVPELVGAQIDGGSVVPLQQTLTVRARRSSPEDSSTRRRQGIS